MERAKKTREKVNKKMRSKRLTQEELNIDEFQVRIAGMCVENRNSLKIYIGDTEYKALYDPGATITLVQAKIAEKVKDRRL